jgi:hypothetical protein
MLLELNAAVGDMLSLNTDRMFQETQIDYAKNVNLFYLWQELLVLYQENVQV